MVGKRVNVLWAILGVVGGMALGAWYMGSRIQSPAEMAARTAAPEPSLILVPVESRVLSTDVVTRGTVRFGLPQPISIAPSTVKGAIGLISSLPRPNTQFGEGEVIMSASGRPVFVLRGEAPAFRDMVGSILLARATNDPALSNAILAAGQRAVLDSGGRKTRRRSAYKAALARRGLIQN